MKPTTGAVTSAITASQSHRRGACPSLDDPIETGDGLLARIRLSQATLSPAQMVRLAELAATYGNGLVEVTARGNLQVRGLNRATAAPFAAAVHEFLAVTNDVAIDHSPIAGIDPEERTDPRPLIDAIREGSKAFSGQLGPKVSVVVDSGGQVPLAELKADIRLCAIGDDHWSVQFGDSKPQVMDGATAAGATVAVLGALAAMGPEARATDLFGDSGVERPSSQTRAPVQAVGSPLRFINGYSVPVALAFGAANSDDLAALLEAAMMHGSDLVRLAPDHTVLFDNAGSDFAGRAAELGFITAEGDPRRRVSACIGSQGCRSGHIASRKVAAALADLVSPGKHLHVSGCGKGCAHPRPAPVTLVGSGAGIGLVIGGRAGDTPQTILDEADLADALVRAQSGR